MSQTPTPAELLESRRIKALMRDGGQTVSPNCFYGNQGPVGPQGIQGQGFTLSTVSVDSAVLYFTNSSGTTGNSLFTFSSTINPLGILNIRGSLNVGSGITTSYLELNQKQAIPLVSTGVLWYNSNTHSLFVDGCNYYPGSIIFSTLESENASTFVSTFTGLGSVGYVSSPSLTSTTLGLGELGYISKASLVSSTKGLGSAGYLSTASLNNALFTLVIPTSSPSGAILFNSQTNSLLVKAQDFVSVVTSSESYDNVFFTVKANTSNTTGATRFGLMNSSSQIINYFYRSANQLYVYTNGVGYPIKSWNSNDLLAITLVSQTPTSQTVSFYVNGSVVYTQVTTDNNQTYKVAITYFNTNDTYTNLVFSGSYGYNTSISSSVFLASYPYDTSPTVSSINFIDENNAYGIASLSNYNSTLYFNNTPLVTNSNIGFPFVSSIQGLGTEGYISSASLISTVQGLGTSAYVSTYTLQDSLVSSIQGLGTQGYISSASFQSSFQTIANIGLISSASLNNAVFKLINTNTTDLILDSATNSLRVYALDNTSVISSAESYNNVFFTCIASISDTSSATKFGLMNSSSQIINYFYNNTRNLYAYTNGTGNLIKSWNSNDSLAITLVSQSPTSQKVSFYVNGSVVYTQATADTNQTYKAAITYFNTGDTYTNLVFSGSYGYNDSNAYIFLPSYPFISSPIFSGLGIVDSTNNSNVILISNYNSSFYVNGSAFGSNNNNSVFSFTTSDPSVVINSASNSIYAPNGTSNLTSYDSYNNVFFSCKANISDTTGVTTFGITSCYFYNSNGFLYISYPTGNSNIKSFSLNDVLSISLKNPAGFSISPNLFVYVNGSNVLSTYINTSNSNYYAVFSNLNSQDIFTSVVFSGSYGSLASNASLFPSFYPFLQNPIYSSIQLINSSNSSNTGNLSNYQSNLYFSSQSVSYNNNTSLFDLNIPPNLNILANSALNTLYASTTTSSVVSTNEYYQTAFFSCKANISSSSNSKFGLFNKNGGYFSYYFYNSNGTVMNDAGSLGYNFNPNNILGISVSSSNVRYYVNGQVSASNTIFMSATPFQAAFGGFTAGDTYSDIVFAGTNTSNSNDTFVIPGSYSLLDYAPVYSTVQLIDTANSNAISKLSNSTLNLYFNNSQIPTFSSFSSQFASSINSLVNVGFISSSTTQGGGAYVFSYKNPNQGFIVFNPSLNSLKVINANLAPALIVSKEGYNSIFFSCVPQIATESDKLFGIVDGSNTFKYFFVPPPFLGGQVKGVFRQGNGPYSSSNSYDLKVWNSNDTFSISVTSKSGSYIVGSNTYFDTTNSIQLYINNIPYPRYQSGANSNITLPYGPFSESFLVGGGSPANGPPLLRAGFQTLSLADSYQNVVISGSYTTSAYSTTTACNAGIGLSSYPAQTAPIYNSALLTDSSNATTSVSLSVYASTLYWGTGGSFPPSTTISATGSIFLTTSTTTLANGSFTLQYTHSNTKTFPYFDFNTANNSFSANSLSYTYNYQNYFPDFNNYGLLVATVEFYNNIFFSCKANLYSNTFSNNGVGNWGQQFGILATYNTINYQLKSDYYKFQYSFGLMNDSNGGFQVNPLRAGLYVIYTAPSGTVSNIRIKQYNSNDTYSIALTNNFPYNSNFSGYSNVVFYVNGNIVYSGHTSNTFLNYAYKAGFSNFFSNGSGSYDTYTNIAVSGSYGITTSNQSNHAVNIYPSHMNYVSSINFRNTGLIDYNNEFNIISLSNFQSTLYFGGNPIKPLGNFSTNVNVALGCNTNAYNPSIGSFNFGSGLGGNVAIGYQAGSSNQDSNTVAIGSNAGNSSQSSYSIALGAGAGNFSQNMNAIAIGTLAGFSTQGPGTLAIGYQAGYINQQASAIAIGKNAGYSNEGFNAIAIGISTGQINQGDSAIALGTAAAFSNQQQSAVAIGIQSGYTNQGVNSISIGESAGYSNEGLNAVAIGTSTGQISQGDYAIAIGYQAGNTNQSSNAIAIGTLAGFSNQGQFSIAIGTYAGVSSQTTNSIVINATGTQTDAVNSGFYVNPLRFTTNTGSNMVSYCTESIITPDYQIDPNELYYTRNFTIQSLNALTEVLSNGTYLTSDSNLKENISSADLNICYNTLKQLPLRRFNYISSLSTSKHDISQIGFIAQEVYPIFPKSIYSTFSHVTSTNILNLNYDQIFMTHYGTTQTLISTMEYITLQTEQKESTIHSLLLMTEQRKSSIQGRNLQLSNIRSMISQIRNLGYSL